MTVKEFQEQIKAGIPDVLPAPKPYDPTINHAPKRKEILTEEERVLAIRNALRYFPAKHQVGPRVRRGVAQVRSYLYVSFPSRL